MTITDEKFAVLRASAATGDIDAALEFGRLLCLLPADPADVGPAGMETGQTWPEEPWLRVTVAARPDDVLAMTLLAGRLVQQIDHLRAAGSPDRDEVAARRDEAESLYCRVLNAEPADPTARAGLVRLADVVAATAASELERPEAYGFHLAEYGYASGSGGGSAYLVAADPGEVRWALDTWLELNRGVWDPDTGLGGAGSPSPPLSAGRRSARSTSRGTSPAGVSTGTPSRSRRSPGRRCPPGTPAASGTRSSTTDTPRS
ncbi:hypothetical protein ACFOVU_12990 [Nocardiopsis sediminis]|uniref:Tetratricopeptide repeat protein n=1 Tax=Nocardiopsis sediminis TaxID=1778267 RepID=A0ABV8FN68_9ACTN